MNDLWNQLATRAGLTLSAGQLQQLDRYLDLLLAANQTMNLTRIDDRASTEIGHVADALTLLPFLPAGAIALADVGSGGGVPGLPLAIARPDAKVTLIEATQKKAAFLRATAEQLGLKNVTVLSDRVESIGRGKLRETFDVATARALAALNMLAEWCVPLVKKDGVVLALKGPKTAEELPAAARALRLLNATATVHPANLPGVADHVIVELRKLGRTDLLYPRSPNVAKKKPL